MANDFEDKSGPQKNVEQKTPSMSEMVGPRPTAENAGLSDKQKKASPDEKREIERQNRMGVAVDENFSRGANIRAQGVTHEEPIILPRVPQGQPQYEEGELIVNDLGDTVPAIKLSAPQMKKAAAQQQQKPGDPAPLPSRK